MAYRYRGLLAGGLLCVVVIGCGERATKSAALQGCEDACHYALECVLGGQDTGSLCTDTCTEQMDTLEQDCVSAYSDLGSCSAGLSCDALVEGACAAEFDAAESACANSEQGSPILVTSSSSGSNGQTSQEGTESADPIATDSNAENTASDSVNTATSQDSNTSTSDSPTNTTAGPIFIGDDVETVIVEGGSDSTPGVIIIEGGNSGGTSSGCIPLSCAAVGATCGTISDGCGGELQCGFCTAPEECGGGGENNVCGCTPIECADLGAECGSVDDGCGGTMECGECGSAEWCGGGGEANLCGCDSQGTSEGFAMSGTNVEGVGTEVWADTELIFAVDGGQSTTRSGTANVNLTSGDQTQWLVASEFGLDIPDNTTVSGIEVNVYRGGFSLGDIADSAVRLVKGGSILTHDKASAKNWGTGMTEAVYGGTSDLWETDWSPADLRDPSFGVALSAHYTTTAGNSWALVDAIAVRVHYSAQCE